MNNLLILDLGLVSKCTLGSDGRYYERGRPGAHWHKIF